jgi:very-short-patch-repair endonuclease
VTWSGAFDELGLTVASREQMLSIGATSRMLTGSVRSGTLLRVRRDHYALPSTDLHVLRAVRVGGRLGCVTALRSLGIFGFESQVTHIHLPRELSRARSPHDRRHRLTPANRAGTELHWSALIEPGAGSEVSVGVMDALAQTVKCNPPHMALASLENALFLRRLDEADIADIFARLPPEHQFLRARIDPRSESGQETVLRAALEDAGIRSEIQVIIPGVGRVDGLIEGRLIWETDSRLAHDGWELHVRDRDRDIDAARLGYMSLRPAYNRTMHSTNDVVDAIRHLLDSTRRR